METKELLKQFVCSRDNRGKIIAAFGYGSGVFKQMGYKLQEQPMIDTIFVVENTHLWHLENMKKNPDDYSRTGKFTLSSFDINAIKGLTGVTYQSNIHFMNSTFKYGIIGKSKFIDSMLGDWSNLFIQGRFHKPTYPILSTDEIDAAIEVNRNIAIFIALLTLEKEHPTLRDLYYQICSISYIGDIRMLFAENPNKINNIVDGNWDELYAIYGDHNQFFYTESNGEIIINRELMAECVSLYPIQIKEYLEKKGLGLNSDNALAQLIKKKIKAINRRDSIIQPLTGLATVGPIKSISYLGEKIKKKTMRS